MQRAWTVLSVALATCGVMPARAATCPFDIPAVTLPPHQVNGFSWGNPIRPLGNACVEAVPVDPIVDQRFYVGRANGLYQTTNSGQTWTHPITGGIAHGALRIITLPGSRQLVHVGAGTKLWLARDRGKNWNVVHEFAQTVRSVLVAPGGPLFVGLGWSTTCSRAAYGSPTWAVATPYFLPSGQARRPHRVDAGARSERRHAPRQRRNLRPSTALQAAFFRSTDAGVIWKTVARTLPGTWSMRPCAPATASSTPLTDGAGLYGSANQAQSWQALFAGVGPTGVLRMDGQAPTRVYRGRVKASTLKGGAFLSVDGGATFTSIGLTGASVAGLALNGPRTRLFAALYASGVNISPIP